MIKGNWKFNLNIDTKSNIKIIDINQTKDAFKINNISISPYSIVVDYEFKESFITTREEEKNNILKRVKMDLDNYNMRVILMRM